MLWLSVALWLWLSLSLSLSSLSLSHSLCLGLKMTSKLARALAHCVNEVRAKDAERFAANLHAHKLARPALFAAHAYNLELAQIASKTTEPHIATMRFAWWRTALDAAARGEPPDHPVAQALAHAIGTRDITPRYLERLLDAREHDVGRTQPETIDELLRYCEHTAGALLLIGCEAAGVADNAPSELAATHAGIACALATLLRGTAAHVSQGCTFIPAEVASSHKLTLKSALSGRPSAELASAVSELAALASAHLLSARSLRGQLPAASRTALVHTVPAELILRNLQMAAYDVYAPHALAPLAPLSLRLHVGWHAWRGSY